jgi:prepilin-type N-terminal cleavage/methylation domain-containing protein
MTRATKKQNLDRGFTLIELLVVIAIIGILSAVVLASLNTARVRARNVSYAAEIQQYQKALALHYTATGSYPGTSAWGCIGTGYPSQLCWDTTYTESNATSVAFRAALAPYIDVTRIPGPSDMTYGTMYRANSNGSYDIIFMLEGDVTCPFGAKQTGYGSYGLTRCNLNGQGL